MSAPTIEQALESAGVRIFSRSTGWLRIAATWRGGTGPNVGVRKDTGRWHDHAANEKGSWNDLKQRLGISGTGIEISPAAAPYVPSANDDPDTYTSTRREVARRTWESGHALTGAHEQKILGSNRSNRQKAKALAGATSQAILWAREYLQSRGPGVLNAAIRAGVRVLPIAHKSSWHPVRKARMPCLLWPVRDPKTGKLVAVQREWGRGHDNKRSIAGHILPVRPGGYETHGAGFVFPPVKRIESPTLYIVEGQISGAAMAATHPESWVLVLFDLNGISIPPRPVIESAITKGAARIVMAGDPGEKGEEHALKGIRKMQEWGLKVPVEWTVPQSPARDKDWADILEQGGPEAVQKAVIEGLKEIPEEPRVVASVAALKNWRMKEAADRIPPVKALPVEQARKVLESGLQAIVEAYIEWLKPDETEDPEMEAVGDGEQPKKKRRKKKKGAPLALFQVTTGVGKTTLLKDLINDAALMADGAVRVFVPDHKQATAYKGWFHYWGRNPDPEHPAYCPNHANMMRAIEQKHTHTQSVFCKTCPNGLRWAMNHYQWETPRHEEARRNLLEMGHTEEEIEQITPCRWQSHLRDALTSRAVVACSSSYSEQLASFGKNDDDSIPGLAIFDEGAGLADTVRVTHEDVSFWAARADSILSRIQNRGDLGDYRKALREARPLFIQLAKSLAELVGKSGRLSVDQGLSEIVDRVLALRGKKGDTAGWEALDFGKKGTLRHAPLRAAWAIAESLKYGGGRVEDGAIIVAASKPIIGRLGKLPTLFADATPDPVTVAICKAKGARIVQAVAHQNVLIIRHPSQFFGHGAWRDEADSDWREAAIAKHKAFLNLYPGAGHIWMKRARLAVDPEMTDSRIEHWGGGHRGHDDFSHKDLCLVGGHFTPEHGWSAAWQSARIAALAAGCPAEDWPAQPDGPIETQNYMDIDEGEAWVQSRHPLPTDQRMREFFLRLATNEQVQGMGRGRGANHKGAPIKIHVFGGFPLFSLGEHGLKVDSYEVDPEEIRGERLKQTVIDRQAVAKALQDGVDRTIRAVRAWIRERTGRTPGLKRTRAFLQELRALARCKETDIEAVVSAVAARGDALLADADGRLDRAEALARLVGDHEASLLMGFAAKVEAGEGLDPEDMIESQGPPVAA